jgi:hypothetical protein
MVEAGKNSNGHHAGVYIGYRFVGLTCLACLSQHHRAPIQFYICTHHTLFTPIREDLLCASSSNPV